VVADSIKKARFFNSFRWQLLLVIIPLSVIPLVLIVIIAASRIYVHLEEQNQKYYSNLLNQVSGNVDYMYNQYAITLADISMLGELNEAVFAPPYRSKQEEIAVSRNISGRQYEDASEAQLRKILESRVDAACYIYEMDRQSLIDNTSYKVHRVFEENFNTFARYDKLLADPLFTHLQENRDVKMVFGRLQPGTMSGISSDQPVFIYPLNRSEGRNGRFTKFILLIVFPGFIEKFYRDIEDFQMGTLMLLDDQNSILTSNHPGSDDYYEFDEKSGRYLLEGDDPAPDLEPMTFKDYQILLTDTSVIETKRLQEILSTLDDEINNVQGDDQVTDQPVQSITTERYKISFKGVSYMMIANFAESSQVKMVYFHPVSQIYKPIIRLITILIVLTFGIIILVAVAGFLLSETLTRPIKHLTNAVFKMSRGDFNIDDVDIKSGNEVGILARGFNFMKKEISRYTQNLETIIDERTREVEEKQKEVEKTNRQLLEKNTMLREQSQFKSQYLANMSHEIRTPLNSILGFNQLLLYRNYDPKLDVFEINEEILQIIDSVETKKAGKQFAEIRSFCESFKTSVIDKDLDLQHMYYSRLQQLASELEKGQGADESIEKIVALGREIEQMHAEEDTNVKKNLRSVRTSGNYLLHLIDSILDISKIEAGKVELTIKDVQVAGFVSEIVAEAKSYLQNKGKEGRVTLDYVIQDSVMDVVWIDKFKMKEVLLNLLSNAIKFTTEGSVQLIVDCNDENLVLEVKDTGVGIKPEERGNLFKEFYRTKTTAMIEGTGLGLALSKKIIELHKGTIDVFSEPGRGSRFVVNIPLSI
jgi:signal transduction histidine kinase